MNIKKDDRGTVTRGIRLGPTLVHPRPFGGPGCPVWRRICSFASKSILQFIGIPSQDGTGKGGNHVVDHDAGHPPVEATSAHWHSHGGSLAGRP